MSAGERRELVRLMVTLYQQGASTFDIAGVVDLSQAAVHRHLRRAGCVMRAPGNRLGGHRKVRR